MLSLSEEDIGEIKSELLTPSLPKSPVKEDQLELELFPDLEVQVLLEPPSPKEFCNLPVYKIVIPLPEDVPKPEEIS